MMLSADGTALVHARRLDHDFCPAVPKTPRKKPHHSSVFIVKRNTLATTQRRSLADVGRDHKNLGAEMGLLAVLQTWTRDLRFHPHVHCVVPAGGLSPDGLRRVRPKDPAYFLPKTALG